MLTDPIAPIFTDDPIATYAEMTAGLPPGIHWVQPFSYSIKELPTAIAMRSLEEMYPDSPLLSSDRDLDSFDVGQGSLGICGSIAQLVAYASIPSDNAFALEKGIYPTERSPHHLYFVRLTDPRDPGRLTWVAVDSVFPVNERGQLLFCRPIGAAGFVAQILLKAMATVRGGSFDELTNSAVFKKKFMGFFPNIDEETTNFPIFKSCFDRGTIATFTFKKPAGTVPDGIVLAHAFAVVDYIEKADRSGTLHQLVRVQNPWGAGKDYVSPAYSENGSMFWADHPDLASKKLAATSAGNFWVGWIELMAIASSVHLRTTL